MTLRPATHQDCEQIRDIWNYYIRDTIATFNPSEKSRHDIGDLIDQKRLHNKPFLVFDTGSIQGFATYGDFRSGAGYAYTQEHTILLHKSATRTGIGRKLLTALEQHADKANIHSMIAGVSAENTQGVDFHIACGFKQVARLPQVGFKFDRWHDLVILQKMLCQETKG